MRFAALRGREVKHVEAARYQCVGEDAPVALPPVALRAQECDPLRACESLQPLEAARELGIASASA